MIAASADNIPLESGSVDIVSVAQAFHWFANEASLAEFSRILKPNGHLVLIWNEQDETIQWVNEVVDFMWKWKDDAPQHRDMKWKECLAKQSFFGPFELSQFDNHQSSDRQGIIDRVFSTSFIAKQPEDQAKIILAGINAILDKHNVFTAATPSGSYPYGTNLHISKKL